MSSQQPAASLGLAEKIRSAQVRLSLIGLGSVGLPLAMAFAEAGLTVAGLDLDRRRVAAILNGEPYITGIESAVLRRQVEEGRLRVSADPSILAESEAVIICVPTPHTRTQPPNILSICH